MITSSFPILQRASSPSVLCPVNVRHANPARRPSLTAKLYNAAIEAAAKRYELRRTPNKSKKSYVFLWERAIAWNRRQVRTDDSFLLLSVLFWRDFTPTSNRSLTVNKEHPPHLCAETSCLAMKSLILCSVRLTYARKEKRKKTPSGLDLRIQLRPAP